MHYVIYSLEPSKSRVNALKRTQFEGQCTHMRKRYQVNEDLGWAEANGMKGRYRKQQMECFVYEERFAFDK